MGYLADVLFGLYILSSSLLVDTQTVDLTLQQDSVGSSVVEACIYKIRNSGIFSEDFNFLRNLAYVDSSDGEDLQPSEPGGIWKVSETTFTLISNSSYDVSAYYSGITTSLDIDWSTVVYNDLAIPLYSALARRLHVAYLETLSDVKIDSEENQAVTWAVHVTDSGETNNFFTTAIASVSSGCEQSNRDIVFLIDSSISNGKVKLEEAKTFLQNVVSWLKVDSNAGSTVIGIAQYASQVNILASLNSSMTESDIKSLISSADTLSGESLTSLSVGYSLFTLFQTSSGAREDETGTPRILCVLLGGDSIDSTGGIETIATTYSVNVIAVSLNSALTKDMLSGVSTGDDSTNAYLPSSFPPSSADEFKVANLLCSASTRLPGGASVSGRLGQNEERKYTLIVPAEGINEKIITTSGSLVIYYSPAIPIPSSAYYDYSISIANPNVETALSYTPTTSELQGATSIIIYLTFQGLSSTPTEYTITVSEFNIEITVNVPETSNGTSLTAGEIAGIVLSGLVLICATIVAVVYYRYGKPFQKRNRFGRLREKFDRPSGSRRSHDRMLEMNVRERLRIAIHRRDYNDLVDATEDFIAMNLDDFNGDFVKAQQIVAVHNCKLGISHAIVAKNVKMLERAIFKAKRLAHDVELKIDVVNAELLLHELKKTDNLLRRLKRAIDCDDSATADSIIAELRVLRGCDRPTVDRMLLGFQLRDDVEEAMLLRDVNGINESISRIVEKGFEEDLAYELKLARKMASDLAVVEKARGDVMGLRQSLVSEIRSYPTPPPGVHEVMMSVYLLLGYHPIQLQSWTAIQALMGKTGREGLRRMIGDLEVRGVDTMHARMAKSLLGSFDLQTIKELSDALAIFYKFAKSVTMEVHKNTPESESPTIYEIPEEFDRSILRR